MNITTTPFLRLSFGRCGVILCILLLFSSSAFAQTGALCRISDLRPDNIPIEDAWTVRSVCSGLAVTAAVCTDNCPANIFLKVGRLANMLGGQFGEVADGPSPFNTNIQGNPEYSLAYFQADSLQAYLPIETSTGELVLAELFQGTFIQALVPDFLEPGSDSIEINEVIAYQFVERDPLLGDIPLTAPTYMQLRPF